MENPKTNPEIPVTPYHTPEIKPGPPPPERLPEPPHHPEIAPGRQDPAPSRSPQEVPVKK